MEIKKRESCNHSLPLLRSEAFFVESLQNGNYVNGNYVNSNYVTEP